MSQQEKVEKSFVHLLDSLYKKKNIKEYINYIGIDKLKTDYYFINFIPEGLRNKIVLDVGTFIPFDAIYWGSVVKEFHGIDYSADVIEFGVEFLKHELAESVCNKIFLQQSDAADLPYEDNFFDVSFSFSTIEHIPGKENRDKAFSEIARVTKKGGYVIITLPNKYNFPTYKKSMKQQRSSKSPFELEVFYTPRELKNILKKNNLKPILFSSSGIDVGGGFQLFSGIFTRIFRKFGYRIGWLAQKKS